MIKRATKIQTVKGVRIAPPRLTGWGYGAVLLYFAGPFLALMALLDLLLYALFRFGFEACYGVLCLVGA